MIPRRVASVGTLIVMFVMPIVLIVAPPAASPAAAQNRLADVTRATCAFSLVATGTWTDGKPEVDVDSSTLRFRFVRIDTDAATADAEGRFGPSHIITRLSGKYLHFMQLFNAGPLYVTTIIDSETSGGKLMAIHTRHEYTKVNLAGYTTKPETYYGECEVVE